jgi:tRNA (guanine-N7-)-methyltransferase
MKTDSDLLFEFTEEEIKENYNLLELTWDLYNELQETLDQTTKDILHIKTHYEQLFTKKGSVIKYCKFSL